MSDLDALRPEIREAVAAIDKGNGVFVNGDDCEGGIAWATVRAELLRLTRENDEWQTRCLQFQTERDEARAELAEVSRMHQQLLDTIGANDQADAIWIIAQHHARELAQSEPPK